MVEFAGFGDMLAKPVLQNCGDTEGEDVSQLVRHLHSVNQPDFTHQEVIHHCWQEGLFPWNMHGKEEVYPLREGNPAVITLRLDDKCNSRMGLLLKRHTPERGSVHAMSPGARQATRPPPVHVQEQGPPQAILHHLRRA